MNVCFNINIERAQYDTQWLHWKACFRTDHTPPLAAVCKESRGPADELRTTVRPYNRITCTNMSTAAGRCDSAMMRCMKGGTCLEGVYSNSAPSSCFLCCTVYYHACISVCWVLFMVGGFPSLFPKETCISEGGPMNACFPQDFQFLFTHCIEPPPLPLLPCPPSPGNPHCSEEITNHLCHFVSCGVRKRTYVLYANMGIWNR